MSDQTINRSKVDHFCVLLMTPQYSFESIKDVQKELEQHPAEALAALDRIEANIRRVRQGVMRSMQKQ